ncbi:MAG TPA: serine/threonine-protein kinase [Gemmatimonadaceae bacterium]|nr:serine/threonine-protein kinase [Gemmatimonadaceae bacterium]
MAAESPLPPSLVTAFRDQYQLIREIGHGGSATVYLARDLKHDRSVAIKVMHEHVSKVSGERFLREIRVSAKMQHPRVLPTYDSGIVEHRLYFVMPFVEGGSLRDRLNEKTSLPIRESLEIARQVAVALAHAHSLGIIHRDVKPENIMFYHGTACLADFGIARPLEELEPGVTQHGTLVGTPGYMSPEQFLTGFDGRSDIYSLCCVLYEMMAGSRLFSGTTPQELVERRSYLLAKSRDEGPVLPDYIDALLDRGLARAPHHRFNDATELVDALDDALDRAERPRRDSGARRALRSIRKRKIEASIAVVSLAVLGLALWPAVRGRVARPGITLQGVSAAATASANPLEAGRAALVAWDIPRAQLELDAAVKSQPVAYAPRLWHAQSLVLARRSGREDFRVAARQLEMFRSEMHGRDSLLAEALLAIAGGRHADACRAYAAQLHRDTLDVLAWYGIGDCHSLDTTVVRDTRSSSGWRFASSFEVAARAYRRVIDLAPAARSAVPFSLMSRILPATAASVRVGRSAPPASQSFVAYPALAGDSVTFVPYPLAVFSSVAPATISPTLPLALQRNQEILVRFATEWTESAPESADAWEALAVAREMRGELDGEGAGVALARARRLSQSPAQQARLAAAAARLHLKEGEFRRARVLADSVFEAANGGTPAADIAEVLAGLAALTGRMDLMARLHVTATSARYANAGVAPPLTAASARFFARAALGVCDDSLASLRRDVERVLESYAPPTRRPSARQMILWQGAMASFPCLRDAAYADLTPTLPLDRAQRAFVAGDPARARLILDSLTIRRAGYRPGDIALDHTVQEAWLRAALGDTAAAERQLDLVLEALPTLNPRTAVQEGAQSAAIGRAMALRAELAAARNDQPTARRWAKNVLELWTRADPGLRPTLDRMKAISR